MSDPSPSSPPPASETLPAQAASADADTAPDARSGARRPAALPKSAIGCPMDSLLKLLMGPWTTYLLWVLRCHGPLRFGALKRKLPGISAKVLTDRLRMLERAGVVFRDHKPTIPPQVTYGLTARGDELGAALKALDEIAQRWREEEEAAARTGRDAG